MFQRRVRSQNGIVRLHNGSRHLQFQSMKSLAQVLINSIAIDWLVPAGRDRRRIAVCSSCRSRPTGAPSAAMWIPIPFHLQMNGTPKIPAKKNKKWINLYLVPNMTARCIDFKGTMINCNNNWIRELIRIDARCLMNEMEGTWSPVQFSARRRMRSETTSAISRPTV